jgi:hypothetical protein
MHPPSSPYGPTGPAPPPSSPADPPRPPHPGPPYPGPQHRSTPPLGLSLPSGAGHGDTWSGRPPAAHGDTWAGQSPPPPARSRPGWFADRWSRFLAVAIGIVLVGFSFALPWSNVIVSTLATTRDLQLIHQDGETSLSLIEVGLGGLVYAALVVILVASTIAAVVVPARLQRPLGLASAGIASAMAVLLGLVWFSLLPAWDAAIDRMAQVSRAVAALTKDPDQSTWFHFSMEGLAVAAFAVMVLAMVALATGWPGTGRIVVAGAGTLFVLASLTLPWVSVYKVTEADVVTDHVGWLGLGSVATGVIGAAVLLLGLVWWAALRRSTRGRLPLLLVTLPVAVLAFLTPDSVDLDADKWLPAAEQARFVHIDSEVLVAAELIQLAPAPLAVAAVLAWHAARRRARKTAGAPADPSGGPAS